jgi:ferritin-like metal-binding protein YciE
MKLPSIDRLLEDELKDIYSAESQLLKALPKMAKAASAGGLKDALSAHRDETRGQVERLDRIAELLGVKLTGKKCVAMEGLIEEGKEVLEADGEPGIVDAALIIAAQKVEHYEMAAYGSARTLAEFLGHDEVARLLQETLDEEKAADEKLTAVSEGEVLPGSAAIAETEDDAGPAKRTKKAKQLSKR